MLPAGRTADPITVAVALVAVALSWGALGCSQPEHADGNSPPRHLAIPPVRAGLDPAPGQRVRVTPAAYAGTNVYHVVYAPPDWSKEGPRLPIVFEYCGNRHAASGSTGRPEGAALGFGLSGGRFLWVALPYVNSARDDVQLTWWGDLTATVEYAKRHVPELITSLHADPNRVILCGFSRGAIAVNHIGLHDDEVANLWTAFITHDHFDGVRAWPGTDWGSPLPIYRQAAATRLHRVAGRPYLVMQNGSTNRAAALVRSVLGDANNFEFLDVNTREILGEFPNATASHPHTDRWLLVPSASRVRVWSWLRAVTR